MTEYLGDIFDFSNVKSISELLDKEPKLCDGFNGSTIIQQNTKQICL